MIIKTHIDRHVRRILMNNLGTTESFDDMDSLDAIGIICELEYQFNTDLPDVLFNQVTNADQLVDRIYWKLTNEQ